MGAEVAVEEGGQEADDQEGEVRAVGDGDVELEACGEDADEEAVEDSCAAGHGSEGWGGGEEEDHRGAWGRP